MTTRHELVVDGIVSARRVTYTGGRSVVARPMIEVLHDHEELVENGYCRHCAPNQHYWKARAREWRAQLIKFEVEWDPDLTF